MIRILILEAQKLTDPSESVPHLERCLLVLGQLLEIKHYLKFRSLPKQLNLN
jgi:hypothetical protein